MKTNAMRILERLGIAFEARTYAVPKTHRSAEEVADELGLPHGQIFKTLVSRVEPVGVVVACIPGGTELDLKALAAAAGGKRAHLVAVKELQGLTGYVRGGCSPFGMKRSYPTFLDRSAESWPTIAINGGSRSCQVCIAPADVVRAADATLADIARPRTA